jgi:hypothetical protein
MFTLSTHEERAMAALHSRPLVLIASTVLLGAVGSMAPIPQAHAATRLVTSCTDGGAGSLRAAAAAANSGDTIDLRGLACNQITLTSGAILIPDQFITIVGAGESRIRIDGNRNGRVFTHNGAWPDGNNATLTLRNLPVQNGLVVGTNPMGGCIYTARHVRLEHVHLRYCTVRPNNPNVRTSFGGGVRSDGNTYLFHAAVYGNRAEQGGNGGGVQLGGDNLLHIDHSVIYNNWSGNRAGGAAAGRIFMTYSTIRDNEAEDISGGIEGGSFAGAHVINKSTISGNVSNRIAGLGFFGGQLLISDSTISGNDAFFTPAGVWLEARGAPITVRNSTITDNTAVEAFAFTAAGVDEYGSINWQSTIIANNFLSGAPSDLWVLLSGGAPGPAVGSDNLIEQCNTSLPSDTLRVDPRLGPLANNGGRTRTHALLEGSPAIDAGNNNAGYAFDQRGEGFQRVVNGRADIGAFEQQD